MSTRSNIVIKKKNKEVESIYCHWNGQLSYNGKMLLEHYTNAEKVKELIELGDISILKPETKPKENEKHSFDKPIDNVVIAYGRDRGEANTDKQVWRSLEEYTRDSENMWLVDYIYVYDEEENKWYYSTNCEDLEELTKEVIEKEI